MSLTDVNFTSRIYTPEPPRQVQGQLHTYTEQRNSHLVTAFRVIWPSLIHSGVLTEQLVNTVTVRIKVLREVGAWLTGATLGL